ncbi:uncharacterized protein LOC143459430 [Clavelina lepadiformis]|uniref:uncharacterized protein LOC143459430 n=1 Tax=Clavelina lepadiformis TaxID=159417 RepID=UPI0040423A16
MLNIKSRLVQAEQVANPVKHIEDLQRIAGRQGEEKVVGLFTTIGGVHESDIFQALRVPDEFQTRRFEIDLVVLCGYGLYCVEIKNWGGQLKVCKDPTYWEQRKVLDSSKSRSTQIQYFNPVSETKKKAEVLRNHLMRAGIYLSENNVFTRVVLTNQSCDIDNRIQSDSCVVTPHKIEDFCSSFNRTLSDMLTDPFIPYFVRGQLSYSQMNQTRAALNQIGTWDILFLNGGKQLFGDLKGCTELSFNRKDIEEMNFSHNRNAIRASLLAVLGYVPTVTVRMFARGGAGWFTRATTASITVPYNLDISFRIAGETTDAKIPANDIDKIMLSN